MADLPQGHPALGRQFFHITTAKLKPGDKLVPFNKLHPEVPESDREPWHQGKHAWRADRVWMSPYRRADLEQGERVTYEVQPSADVVHHNSTPQYDPHGLDSLGHNQWHASEATVVKKLRRRG